MRTADNIMAHELIGLPTVIKYSACKEYIGTTGEICDETKNMIGILGSRRKMVPKKGTVFSVKIDNGYVDILGDQIIYKLDERTKRVVYDKEKHRI